MNLTTRLGKALDAAFAAVPALRGFTTQKVRGADLRRWTQESPALQTELFVYRDKWWTQDGGRLYAEVRCLVPAVQLAVAGVPQSLAAPDYASPLVDFQYGLSDGDVQREWQVDAATSMAGLTSEFRAWFTDVAVAWMSRFESMPAVITELEHRRDFRTLALLHVHRDDWPAARAALARWVEQLPRGLERQLGRLVEVALLEAPVAEALRLASLQHEDEFHRHAAALAASLRAGPPAP